MHVWVCVVFIGMYYEFLRPWGTQIVSITKKENQAKGQYT